MSALEHRSLGHFEHLRRRLFWKLLIAYVTPLVILSAYFLFQYVRNVRESTDNHLVSIAENQRNTVDLFLEERVANMRSVFRSISVDPEPPRDSMQMVLADLRNESPTFVDVGLFRSGGRLVSYAGEHPDLQGMDYSDQPWFRKILDMDRDYFVSDVYLGYRNRPHFVVATRHRVANKPWILRASVDPERFWKWFRGSWMEGEGEAFIVNAEGKRQTFSESGGIDEVWAKPPPRGSGVHVTNVKRDGADYRCAFAWLKHGDWALVVRVPANQAGAPLFRTLLFSLGLLLAALALIVILVARNTRSVVGQLEEADRTKETLQAQLISAAKLASVGEMAAGVAHEINNPLAIIHEEAGLMLDILDPEFGQELDPDDVRDRLKEISAATIRGRDITSKLLAFSRRHDPVPEPTDIHVLADRVLQMKAQEFKVHDIDVRRSYAGSLPLLLLSQNQIEQVLLNLLNNAMHAMDKGGSVRIKTSHDARVVRLSVSDTGCGMSAEQLENVFFPFYTTKEVGKGTGLGLSISHGIVEAHGGRIEAESKPGRGTTLTISLPIPDEAELRTARNRD